MEVLTDRSQLAAVLSPLRLRLLAESRQPQSATTLSALVGVPRQKINYHLRELEREGFLELVEERQRRGCVERMLKITSRAFVVSPALLGQLADDPDELRDRFSSAYLVSAATKLIHDVALLRDRARAVGQKLATVTLEVEIGLASPAALRSLTEEIASEIGRLAAKYHRPSGAGSRRFRLVVGAHPVVTKTGVEAAAEAAQQRKPVRRNIARRRS